MTRKKGFWFIVVSVIILVVGGYFYYNNVYSADTPEEEAAPVQTAVARLGDLIIFAGGAGQIVDRKSVV